MSNREADSVPDASDEPGVNRRVLGSTAMWATCALVSIGGYQLLVGQQHPPINLVLILVLLGLLATTSLIRPSLGMLTLLGLGLLLAFPLPVEWLQSMWPPAGAIRGVGGMTVLVVALVTAIWRRPPSRRPDGTSVVASRLVNWVALLCAVGGPVIGWAAFFAFTRGDLFGRDAIVGMVGLAVGLFGLVLFSGYSAFHVLTGRPGQAAILAVAYPALLLALALAGPRWVVSRPPLADAITENRLADGRLVRASRASPDEPPAKALDRRVDTAWNAATHAPAWIEIDLGKPSTIKEIRLLVAQFPDGETYHQIIGISSTGSVQPLAEFRGFTRDGDWLTQSLATPVADVRSVRITTLVSPSWVAWNEIELDVKGR